MSQNLSISKILSANDLGLTGAHQAGTLIPKQKEILAFFPTLPPGLKNPRQELVFLDGANQRWEWVFIYYNNRFYGGTRNEYRLTHMTAFFRQHQLQPGDELILTLRPDGLRAISYKRVKANSSATGKLKLSGQWKVIEL